MKTNDKTVALFSEIFKFKLNEEVRHKADGKNNDWDAGADMGLLIVARTIQEEEDSDGNTIYQRHYHCRTIKHSGSGQLISFLEQELLSKEEYMRKNIQDREWRDNVREQMKQNEIEIFESFGVKRGSQINLIKDGAIDETEIYVISGYETSENGIFISARIKYGEGVKMGTVKLSSKSDFKILVN